MTEKVDFTGVESTMLVTLYLKALEGRSKDSILNDHVAAEVVDRIDEDFARLVPRSGAGNRFMLALRARQLDEWAADFLRGIRVLSCCILAAGWTAPATRNFYRVFRFEF